MVRADKANVRTPRCSWLLLRLITLIGSLVFTGPIYAKGNLQREKSEALKVGEKLEAEQLLVNLGYWTGPVDGVLDPAFRHALIAFQKIEGRKRSGKLTRRELDVLRSAIKPSPRHTAFPHVEIDLRRQVLFIVDENGSVTHILPVSSGNEQLYWDQGQIHRAHTPTGSFRVLRKIQGWRKSTLGLLYYPSYISGGIAIHGSPSVPAQAASHGCIRIPMYAAKEMSLIVPVGTDVLVYND